MTPNQTQGIGHQTYPAYVNCATPSPQIFVRFVLRLAVFEIFYILDFSIDSHVKSATKFLFIYLFIYLYYFFADRQNIHTLHSSMTALFINKFDSDRMKTVGQVAF